jgi:hypothetical protein
MMDAVSKAVLAGNASLADARIVWHRMNSDDVAPNSRTYAALFTVYANAALVNRVSTMPVAMEMWERLMAEGLLSPKTGTYNAMLNCMSKNAAVHTVACITCL